MLSKTYLTANLIDINQLEGPDSFQKAKKSSIQDIIYQRQPSNIPLKHKATPIVAKIKARGASNLTLSKLKKKTVEMSSMRLNQEHERYTQGIGSSNVDTRVRESLKSREKGDSKNRGRPAGQRGQTPEVRAHQSIYRNKKELEFSPDRNQLRSSKQIERTAKQPMAKEAGQGKA